MFARILFAIVFTFFASSSMASPVCVQKYERGTPQFNRCIAESRQGQSSLDIQMELSNVSKQVATDTRIPEAARQTIQRDNERFYGGLLEHCRKTSPGNVQACLDIKQANRIKNLRAWHAESLKVAGY